MNVGALGFNLPPVPVSAPVAPGWTWLSTTTQTSQAQIDVETTFDSTYDMYCAEFEVQNVPANAASALKLRLKIGGAYITTGTYGWRTIADAGAAVNGSADDHISMAASVGSNANPTTSISWGIMYIALPSSTVFTKGVFGDLIVQDATSPTTGPTRTKFSGQNSGTGALTGIRLFLQTGNITGTVRLYGFRKS